MTPVYILSAVRTAIGSFGGSLKQSAPIDLGICATKEAITRSGLAADEIEHGVFGNVIHTEPRDMYISRCITIGAGMADSAPALTVNRLCGSGLQAVVSATQLIQLGDTQSAVAGGAEVMSKGGYLVPAMRWGARLGHTEMTDMMLGALRSLWSGSYGYQQKMLPQIIIFRARIWMNLPCPASNAQPMRLNRDIF